MLNRLRGTAGPLLSLNFSNILKFVNGMLSLALALELAVGLGLGLRLG